MNPKIKELLKKITGEDNINTLVGNVDNGTALTDIFQSSDFTASDMQELITEFNSKASYKFMGIKKDEVIPKFLCYYIKSYNPNVKKKNKLEILRTFIENGFSVKDQNALFNAIKGNNIEAVKMLLDAGADIHVKTPFDPKFDSGEKGVIQIATDFQSAVSIKMIKFLVDKGADINYQDKSGLTGLHYQCNIVTPKKSAKIVKEMLEMGADPNIKDKDDYYHGKTPLMCACEYRVCPVALVLLDSQKCDVNYQSNRGDTALNLLIEGNPTIPDDAHDFPDMIKIIRALLDAGLDTKIKNKDGRNAIEVIQYNQKIWEKTKDSYGKKYKVFLSEVIDIIKEHQFTNLAKNMTETSISF